MAQDFWTGPGNLPTENEVSKNNTGVHPCVDTKGNQEGYCNPYLLGSLLVPAPYVNVTIPAMGDIVNETSAALFGETGDDAVATAINEAQTEHLAVLPPNQISTGMIMIGNVSSANLTMTGFSGSLLGDSSVQGTIEFELLSDGNVVLYYGGHISETKDYFSFDGINGDTGNQDMQLSSAAIIPAGELKLVKVVINDDGGNATADQWELCAESPHPNDALNYCIDGANGTMTEIIPDEIYTLNETGPDGYVASDWSCEGGTFTAPNQISVASGQNATCTITNDDDPARLKLVKELDFNDGGSATVGNWTLYAETNGTSDGRDFSYNGSQIKLTI
jgi:hypothetical protein